ncbi:hypothetical protein AVEN_34585-1, partial [Araneus ventricosus]
GCCSC